MIALALDPEFFARPVREVAPDLLGKFLVSKKRSGIITEVEAYDGPHDLASHGRFGVTERTKVMFGPAGNWYVYLCYGVHWMLNVVTGDEGYPAAVLIRGAGEWNGPGKVTKAFGIAHAMNGKRISETSGLWIEDRGVTVRSDDIECMPRIGVDYAGAWADKRWRFVLKGDYLYAA